MSGLTGNSFSLPLAESWDRPATAPAAEDEDVDVPDDSGVDHTGDAREFEDA